MTYVVVVCKGNGREKELTMDPTSLDNAQKVRDEHQEAALAGGMTLEQRRYAVRPAGVAP